MNIKHFTNSLYIFKILSCAIIIVILALLFDSNKDTNFFLWASLTAFFTIQFDLDKKINFNQVTGNFIGSVIGILIWIAMDRTPFIHTYNINLEYFFLILGILITTSFCVLLKATEYVGIALSSFLIVTVYDVGHHSIDGALLRISYCFIGCLVAYLVEYFYLLVSKKIKLNQPSKQ
ncbi:aromatic acid exporter family protein [Acinetobacter gerneri]|uniref:FUSC family protein n=1 Tax=Acinetobacter gerneri DSM 14967 = CIP 107464 = MTCC 9824 TaxID=1120926 RepID=N8YF22_9GAMM|nr:aromatic acid exporter family protein [Acinetobacter gerneri]ENV35256.1 hypothetical protein F960_00554 [Acinetobacter gerneri DSM 14967 = CIP 107464 = MTCC 9824]EPR83501.1 hypothetical protein L289_2240 [Acinetobacter gerneri DSM 14967 = CIP 107464 = MTCC 9824]